MKWPVISNLPGTTWWSAMSKATVKGTERADAHGKSIEDPHITMQMYIALTVDAMHADRSVPKTARLLWGSCIASDATFGTLLGQPREHESFIGLWVKENPLGCSRTQAI